MEDRSAGRWQRILTAVLLIVAALFYLQFGLQALVHYLPQGALSLVGAAALGWGAALRMRGKPASSVVLVGTLPILALHAALTLVDSGEMPFLIGSTPVPAAATIAKFVAGGARRPFVELERGRVHDEFSR